jgi:hypothetical protein
MDYIEYIIYALIFFYLVGRFSTKEDKAHKQVRKKIASRQAKKKVYQPKPMQMMTIS